MTNSAKMVRTLLKKTPYWCTMTWKQAFQLEWLSNDAWWCHGRWITSQTADNAELWSFLYCSPEKALHKQSSFWWFEMPCQSHGMRYVLLLHKWCVTWSSNVCLIISPFVIFSNSCLALLCGVINWDSYGRQNTSTMVSNYYESDASR